MSKHDYTFTSKKTRNGFEVKAYYTGDHPAIPNGELICEHTESYSEKMIYLKTLVIIIIGVIIALPPIVSSIGQTDTLTKTKNDMGGYSTSGTRFINTMGMALTGVGALLLLSACMLPACCIRQDKTELRAIEACRAKARSAIDQIIESNQYVRSGDISAPPSAPVDLSGAAAARAFVDTHGSDAQAVMEFDKQGHTRLRLAESSTTLTTPLIGHG